MGEHMTAVTLDLPPTHGSRRARRATASRAFGGLVEVLARVRRWMGENESRVKKVYVVSDADGLTLRVVPKSAAHDFELTNSLCDLTIEFADAGLDVLGSQIPDGTPEETAAYFDPARAIVLTWV
jgi:hypothetical protein